MTKLSPRTHFSHLKVLTRIVDFLIASKIYCIYCVLCIWKPVENAMLMNFNFRLWDMTSRSLIGKTAFNVTTRSAAFAPDGSTLAVGHGDGSFRVLKGR